MTNPINPFSRSSASSINDNSSKTQHSERSNEQAAPRANNTADTVSLSQESQQVTSLQQQLKNSPAVDQAKVDSIKQEISNGNYPLDAEKIAANLIKLEQSLLE